MMTTRLPQAFIFGVNRMAKEGFSPEIIDDFVLALSYTAAMVAAALKMEDASYQLQGATIGKMISDPILNSIEPTLREKVAQCEGVGDPNEEFPNGEWLYCSENGDFDRAKWAMAGCAYFFIGLGMQLGTKHQRLTGCLSGALVGSSFLVNGVFEYVAALSINFANFAIRQHLFSINGICCS